MLADTFERGVATMDRAWVTVLSHANVNLSLYGQIDACWKVGQVVLGRNKVK